MSLSIVVPVLDRDEPLRRCIASILRVQPASRRVESLMVDVVIVDDGSSAEFSVVADDIAAIYGGNVQVVHRPNRGASAARNAGLGFAAGEFVMFLDSDDELAPGGLAAAASLIAGGGDELGLACLATRVLGVDRSTKVVGPAVRPGVPGVMLSELAGSFVVRTSVAVAAGGYDTELRYGENTDVILRLADACRTQRLRVAASDEVLSIYHEPAGRRRYDAERLDAALHLLRRGRFDLALPAERAKLHGIAAVNATRLRRYPLAVRQAAAAARAEPTNLRHLARLGLSLTGPFARRRWLADR